MDGGWSWRFGEASKVEAGNGRCRQVEPRWKFQVRGPIGTCPNRGLNVESQNFAGVLVLFYFQLIQ